MDEQSQKERLAEHQRQQLNQCRGRQFVRKTFFTYPSLRSREPGDWGDQQEYHLSAPYTGQEHDPEEYEVVEDGWDHEHCHVCWVRIDPGDEYWQSVEEHPLELCLACYERLATTPSE